MISRFELRELIEYLNLSYLGNSLKKNLAHFIVDDFEQHRNIKQIGLCGYSLLFTIVIQNFHLDYFIFVSLFISLRSSKIQLSSPIMYLDS